MTSVKPKRRASDGEQGGYVSTGVAGLDQILQGGYPSGRPTVIRGASGTGKTIYSLLFASQPKEGTGSEAPAVFATFDESPNSLQAYLRALGRKTEVTFVDFRPDPDMQVVGPSIELGGLLTRIGYAVESTGATRLVLDAFDTLFDTYGDKAQVRRDLFRVFDWCRNRGVTLVATAGEEAGYRASTGTMDYASDCTILLGQRLENGLMTRVLRVLKCRGKRHGTNEYPYLIESRGISVMPVTEMRMTGKSSRRRLSTGIAQLDQMMGGRGFWQGSTVMVSGQSGSGKSLLATNIAATACSRGERVLYFSFEEAPEQIVRDVRSTGTNLRPYLKSGILTIESQRPVERGLEEHVITLMNAVAEVKPDIVLLDPVSALADVGDARAFKNTVLRLCHFFKSHGVTAVLTELLPDDKREGSGLNISSLIDTWIRLRRREQNGQLTRLILIHKSRGSRTSDRVMTFRITSRGIMIDGPDE